MLADKKNKDLSYKVLFSESPKKIFEAINNVRGWWSEELKGKSDKLGGKFTYKYKDMHESTQKISELVPNKKVVWKVSDARLYFLKNQTEWNGTETIFEIKKKDDKTELIFTHKGLTPDVECYEACHQGWGYYIKTSLPRLIRKGKGKPNPEA